MLRLGEDDWCNELFEEASCGSFVIFLFSPSYAGFPVTVAETREPERSSEAHEGGCVMPNGTQPPTNNEGRGRASDATLTGAKERLPADFNVMLFP